MPPRFGIQAPKCARCEKSVYLAEQVIGPSSLPYHKTCLTCIACNKRLDSTLLLEHEGKPYCKNCHKAHLGTGKGGFNTAVPLNPTIPNHSTHSNQNSPSTKDDRHTFHRERDRDSWDRSPIITPTLNSNHSYQTTSINHNHPNHSVSNHGEIERDRLDLQQEVPIIIVKGRGDGAKLDSSEISTSTTENNRNGISTSSSSSNNPSQPQPSTPFKPSYLSSNSTSVASGRDHVIEKNVRSLDEAVSGSSQPRIIPRSSISTTNATSNPIPETIKGIDRSQEIDEQDIGWDEDFREREREKRRLERERQASYSRPENLSSSQGVQGQPRSIKAGSNEYRQSLGSNAQHSQISFPQDHPPRSSNPNLSSTTNGIIGSISAPLSSPNSNSTSNGGISKGSDGLPEPKRRNLPGASHTAKIASPAPLSHGPISGVSADQITSGIGKLGLGSSISAAAGGTPLCARCEKAVYFAEQKTAAGRKWHRACLRCDSCSTTLEAGKLEEGPPSAADAASIKRMRGGDDSNVFCRTCYAKFFGPKGLGVGLSYPNSVGGH